MGSGLIILPHSNLPWIIYLRFSTIGNKTGAKKDGKLTLLYTKDILSAWITVDETPI